MELTQKVLAESFLKPSYALISLTEREDGALLAPPPPPPPPSPPPPPAPTALVSAPQPLMSPDVATVTGKVARGEDTGSGVAHSGRVVQWGYVWSALLNRTSGFLLPWSLKSSQ